MIEERTRMQRIRAHLSFANAIALIALFVALGGSSYAAITLARNSVGAKQIKAGAVRSSEVKDGSLLRKDFKSGQLPAGPQGPQGLQGPAGTPGAAGAPGAPGTATAFARIAADGTLEPGTSNGVAQFKGVDQTDVQHAAAGTYCFGSLGFDIASAMVSADNAGAATTTDQIASVAIQRGNTLGTCDADHQQARVNVFDVSDTRLVDARFTIWFEQ
jgi:hypothetical protein